MNVKKTMTAMILRHHFVSRDNAKNASIRERSVIDLPSQDFAKKMIMFEVDVQYLVIYVVNREKTKNKDASIRELSVKNSPKSDKNSAKQIATFEINVVHLAIYAERMKKMMLKKNASIRELGVKNTPKLDKNSAKQITTFEINDVKEECIDTGTRCEKYTKIGQKFCQTNSYIRNKCRASCNLCGENEENDVKEECIDT